jgi:oligopeptidase B
LRLGDFSALVSAVIRQTLLGLTLLFPFVACAPAAPPVTSPPPVMSATPSVSATAAVATVEESGPKAPIAKKEPVVTTIHGEKRVDDYAWLRKKGSPEVLSYLAAENAYTDTMTSGTAELREKLYSEMLGRLKETDDSPPYKDGAWLYYSRTEQGKQYPIYCRKSAKGDAKKPAKEVVMIDLNEIGKSEKFVAVDVMEVSDDGNLLAYSIDTQGYRQYTLAIKDLRTNEVMKEKMPRVDAVAWAKDGKSLFYVTEDDTTKRHNKLFRHLLGDDPSKDALVYEEKDEMFDLDVERTRSKEFILATSSSRTTSEVRFIPADKPKSEPKVIAERVPGHEYYVSHSGDSFFIMTNSGGRNFRVVTAKTNDYKRASWKELIAHRDDVMLETLMLFSDHYVLYEREDGLPRLRVGDLKNEKFHRIDLPEPVYTLSPDHNVEFKTSAFRFRYQSLVTPETWFTWDLTKKERKELKTTEVVGYDKTKYESQRVHATAKDGTKIPVSLVYAKGTKPDGTHPMVLYAYGSYGYAYPDNFFQERVSLLDRGVVFAITHIRGGGELGKKWHDEGRLMTKMNTFTDFIDSAESLVKMGWADKARIAIEGASAGGLLMGAVTNLRPDLWRAVVAHVPFVDVINTELDETLPLTVTEFEEWGNPKVKADYDYMMKYSPYDNVVAKPYPAILVRTSYNDSQVMYWEPAKWVAKLRALKTDKNTLLLKINMDPAGHGGQSGRYDRLRETAFTQAFVLTQLGAAK